MVDLLALASRSTSHRPSCPEARRAMPRYRPGTGCPARYRHGAVTLPRTSPRQRSGTVRTVARRASWGGSPMPRPCSHPPTARRTGRPSDWESVAFVPCTGSADADLAEAWNRPVFRRPHPEVDPTDSVPVPVGVALSGTGHTLPHASPQVKGYFRIHRVLPRTFSLPTGNVAFIHRSCTALPTVDAAGQGAGAPAVPNRASTSERRDVAIRLRRVDAPAPERLNGAVIMTSTPLGAAAIIIIP